MELPVRWVEESVRDHGFPPAGVGMGRTVPIRRKPVTIDLESRWLLRPGLEEDQSGSDRTQSLL